MDESYYLFKKGAILYEGVMRWSITRAGNASTGVEGGTFMW